MDMEDTGTNKYQKLVKSGIGSIIYSHSATDIPVHLSPGKYILKSVDPKTGAITVIAKRLNIKDVGDRRTGTPPPRSRTWPIAE